MPIYFVQLCHIWQTVVTLEHIAQLHLNLNAHVYSGWSCKTWSISGVAAAW